MGTSCASSYILSPSAYEAMQNPMIATPVRQVTPSHMSVAGDSTTATSCFRSMGTSNWDTTFFIFFWHMFPIVSMFFAFGLRCGKHGHEGGAIYRGIGAFSCSCRKSERLLPRHKFGGSATTGLMDRKEVEPVFSRVGAESRGRTMQSCEVESQAFACFCSKHLIFFAYYLYNAFI